MPKLKYSQLKILREVAGSRLLPNSIQIYRINKLKLIWNFTGTKFSINIQNSHHNINISDHLII